MIDDKSKQWFGASVHSSGQDGIIVVRFTFNFLYYWSLRLGIQSDIPTLQHRKLQCQTG